MPRSSVKVKNRKKYRIKDPLRSPLRRSFLAILLAQAAWPLPALAKEFVYDHPSGNGLNSVPQVDVQASSPTQLNATAVAPGGIYTGAEESPFNMAAPNDPPSVELYVSTAEDQSEIVEVARNVPVPTEMIELKPWWDDLLRERLTSDAVEIQRVELDELVWQAMASSPQIQAILTEPAIRETEIAQAAAIFDPTRFVDSIFHDTSDPVGNLLTTGGAPRLNEHYMENSLGVRGRNQFGGQTELFQDIGLRNNNSQFFVPGQQADTRMVLKYSHPLRRGAGRFYNASTIAIARVSADISRSDANLAIQNHIFEVYQTYWTIFYHRATLLQGHRAIGRLTKIAENIAARADIDGTRSQASRARAAVSSQEARTQRSAAELAKAEAQMRALLNFRDTYKTVKSELIPITQPMNEFVPADIAAELAIALESRPEVIALHDQIRSMHIQLKVAENELRPTLNLVTEGYIRGLNGDYNISDSFGDQFARGRPSYSAGLTYQRPKNNSASRAIMRQRNLELRRLLFTLDQQLLDVSREIHAAAAEIEASFAEYRSAVAATLSTNEELQYLVARWSTNPVLENTSPALLMDEILDAESRLIQTENNWALAQSTYMIALGRAKLASGTLFSISGYVPQTDLPDSEN